MACGLKFSTLVLGGVWVACFLMIGQLETAHLQAQATTAAISGTVTDTSGALIADAEIIVTNTGTGIFHRARCDAQGRYLVPELAVGDYEVSAAKAGFATVLHSGITLSVGAQLVVDLTLSVGQAQQTVTVSSDIAQVDTTSSTIANLVETTQMRELPLNGRNFQQLLTLSPGVIPMQTAGAALFGQNQGYAISGARPEGQVFLLDNSNIQDFWNHGSGSGALGTSLGVDAIAEFQTLTSTYSAQFGGNGSVMNAASKSGTNSFHGSGYEFIRNSALDSRNFFDGNKTPPFRRNQFGGTLGGPIRKDRAFFFVNDEKLLASLGETVTAFVPDSNARLGYLPCSIATKYTCNTATNLAYVGVAPSVAPTLALYPVAGFATSSGIAQLPQVANQISHENYLLVRADYRLSEKDSFFARYVDDRGSRVSPFATSANTIPTWPELDTTGNHFATVSETHIFRPTLVNVVTVSYNRPHEAGTTSGNTPPLNFWPGSNFINGSVTVSGLSPLGPVQTLPFNVLLNKFTESDDVIWTHGAHTVTFGASVNRQQDNDTGPNNQNGTFAFTSLLNLMTGSTSSFQGGIPGQYDATRAIRELEFAFYSNDSWKVSRRLTLNIGLRYEPARNPTEAFGNFYELLSSPYGAITQVKQFWAHNPSLKNFDPRFGFAFDPFGDHKTSFRGGFGIFHDPQTARIIGPCTTGFYPAQLYNQVNPIYPTPLTAITPSIPTIGPGCSFAPFTPTPYMMQYNLNVQRQLGGGTVLTVGYVGSRGVHLGQNVDVNAPISSGGVLGPYASIQTKNGVSTFVTNPRPNPAFSTVGMIETEGLSRYNSLQVNLQRRLTKNWQGQVSYTWSRSIDTTSTYFGEGGSLGGVEVPTDIALDVGPSAFNLNQVLTANSLYVLPFKGNKWIEGWQISGILTATSGYPFTVNTGITQAWTPNNKPMRPNYVAGCNWRVGAVREWYNPACFTAPPVGYIGNLGRNNLVGPGLVNQDFALMKDTRIPRISEQFDVQFRAEIYNIFNHANFALPSSASIFTGGGLNPVGISPAAGVITSTATTSRQIQFGLKILF